MDKVQSFEQYKETLKLAKSKGYVLSNCFLLPAAVRQKIQDASLFFHWIEHGLLLLDDRSDFYRCCYFLPASEFPGQISLGKPSVIEFPFNGTPNQSQLLQIRMIESMGFHLGRESGLMSASSDRIREVSPAQEPGPVCAAEPEDAPEILALMYASFNPLYAFLPTEEELETAIREGRVLVIRSGDKVAAALISGFERGIASIQQVAVDPAFRGKRLGRQIVEHYHAKYMEEARSFQHWVDLNNRVALNLYHSFGYELVSRKANEYIF